MLLEVLEVVSRRNAHRLSERGVIEVHPRVHGLAVLERHRHLHADVQAPIETTRPMAFHRVETGQYRFRIEDLEHLSVDAAVARPRRRIQAEVEEHRLDPASPHEGQLRVDVDAKPAVEPRHQSSVEEYTLSHEPLVRRSGQSESEGGDARSARSAY